MPGQSTRNERARIAGEERPKRQERAHRILDAAAELIQRWGYKKTAVDDIARSAGVAKGTIYLHWKTREDLFMALLLREGVETAKAMFERIHDDPNGVYLSNIVKYAMYEIMTRPLARALFVQDANILGELLQSERQNVGLLAQQKLLVGQQMFELFRAKGALRTDQDMAAQIKIYSALVVGFMTVDQYLPEELHSSPEEVTQLLAATIHQALEPAEPLAPEVLGELREMWDQYARQFLQLFEERLQQALE